jgi:hypothetical protein
MFDSYERELYSVAVLCALTVVPRLLPCLTPFPLQEKTKDKKIKLGLKYMYYNVHCTYIGLYISDFLKLLSKMFCSIL